MKFNTKTKSTQPRKVNEAGGESFEKSPKLEVINLLLTSFVKDQFYRSAESQLDRLPALLDEISDKRFIGKTAVFARNEFGMRSITHAMAGEIGNKVKGKQWTKRFFESIVYRPDDMTEIIAYTLGKYGKPIPNAMKRGFRRAFQKFDEYQLAKYRNSNANVSLVDVVNLVHPKHNEAIGKLVNDELRQHGTWENKLSKAGQEDKEKSEVWKELLQENKLGYFALLRNLRNILEQAPEMVDEAVNQLTNKEVIRKTLVMPFRYKTAMDEIQKVNSNKTRTVLQGLSRAFELSLDNVPEFDGKTLVVLDESGSMGGEPIELGSVFASILYKSNNADLMTFTDEARYQNLNPTDAALTIAQRLRDNLIGRGTNFHSIFETADKPYDRIIILSDMQGWIGYNAPTGTFEKWKTKYNCNPYIYSFDLQGYDSMQFPEDNVFCLSGFSNRIFDVMDKLESDKDAMVNEIEKVNL